MPRLDGTGPMGYGAGTGRGFGPCCSGLGRGLGRGYGFRRTWTKQDEKTALEEEVKILKEELKVTEEGLRSLKGQK
ncbi:MAG: hypothetical protein A2V69_02455 [Candidatus Portnoybacteria bacterium RBG_13_40_8]|uniref:Cytoplasmic protein n=1 Tax=Candidatus Portnoybacteria bacterium RBG_13_40_8 TaxID=1801990 RepID=A0A1G2F3E0_9BACT|nr:MAG: hypothetical protein A2V69_02455 [Candidatus Portnoybacteria bacterium RBG_13_40_8]OGZ34593.1 MAG: hypothetical protein A2V60_02330 [Candidatus Portnoybacteria bacterium RIFCSPHIGHO2_01_FULL_39_19]